YYHEGPTAVRYPRGSGTGINASKSLETIEIGKAEVKREGKDIAILSFGSLLGKAEEVAEKLDATLVDMRFVKPLDTDLIDKLVKSHKRLVTLEENAIAGGAGSAVNEYIASQGKTIKITNLGIPDRFVEHGEPEDLLARCGLDVDGILKAIDA
ncbi:MAG: 1-deoxy-D-xylulose-5-phosphate synthase, partial [Gammaproteobacteria bacterium]|nr:1-deoxy-D-xylulose-5-phosphate synthase [Gammaproteobacteria bacterium]